MSVCSGHCRNVVVSWRMFMGGEMRARYQKTTDAGRKEAAVISLLWENKRLVDFVMLSSSVSEYSSRITSQQNRSHPVYADMQCDGISPPVSADTVMCSTKKHEEADQECTEILTISMLD